MKTFTKTLALTLFATTAMQAMDNQPKPDENKPSRSFARKLALSVPGPKKTVVGTTILTGILGYFFPEQIVSVVVPALAFSAFQNQVIAPEEDRISTEDIEEFNNLPWDSDWDWQKKLKHQEFMENLNRKQ